MRLSKKIFFLSTCLIVSFLTCSTEARLIQRQAYMICKTDEVAFWNGSSGQCCRGDIFKALETNNYQCCETPNVISTVLGNPYLKSCCPPGQTPYTTSTPSNPETSTLSWCCDGDASEVAGRSGFFKCCSKGEKAFWDGSNEQCCNGAPVPVAGWGGEVHHCCPEGSTAYAHQGSLGECCTAEKPAAVVEGRSSLAFCCPPGVKAAMNDGCCLDGTVPAYSETSSYPVKCCKAGQIAVYNKYQYKYDCKDA